MDISCDRIAVVMPVYDINSEWTGFCCSQTLADHLISGRIRGRICPRLLGCLHYLGSLFVLARDASHTSERVGCETDDVLFCQTRC